MIRERDRLKGKQWRVGQTLQDGAYYSHCVWATLIVIC
jgi:hypothetical protein